MTVDSKQVLYDNKVISDFDLQTSRNALQEAEAALAQAKAQETNARNDLSYTVVKSPVDGVTGMLPYSCRGTCGCQHQRTAGHGL